MCCFLGHNMMCCNRRAAFLACVIAKISSDNNSTVILPIELKRHSYYDEFSSEPAWFDFDLTVSIFLGPSGEHKKNPTNNNAVLELISHAFLYAENTKIDRANKPTFTLNLLFHFPIK